MAQPPHQLRVVDLADRVFVALRWHRRRRLFFLVLVSHFSVGIGLLLYCTVRAKLRLAADVRTRKTPTRARNAHKPSTQSK